jgi:hypothetical protein
VKSPTSALTEDANMATVCISYELKWHGCHN